jgi:hypothetical protein
MTNKCIVNGEEVPHLGNGTFCNVTTVISNTRYNNVMHMKAARCNLVNQGIHKTDPLYPYLVVPDLPGTEYRTWFGKIDTNSSSLLGSLLCFDAKYCPKYIALMSFVYNGNGVPTGLLYLDCLLGKTTPGDAFAFELFGGGGSRCFNTLRGSVKCPFEDQICGVQRHYCNGRARWRRQRNGCLQDGWPGARIDGCQDQTPALGDTLSRVQSEHSCRRHFGGCFLLCIFH